MLVEVLSKLDDLLRTSKLLIMLVLLCLISLRARSQLVTTPNTVSTNTGGYEECVSLIVRPDTGWVGLEFIFNNVSGPLDISDFASEPSFIKIMVVGARKPDDNRTSVLVTLNNTSVGSISQGKLKADILKAKFENFFDISLPYCENFTHDDIVAYGYSIYESPTIQKFRDVFLEHKPSQGFSQIATPALIGNDVTISFSLKRNGDYFEWMSIAIVDYTNYFEMKLGQEYNVSLRELTGSSEVIQSSPESLESTLNIRIFQVNKDYKLISLVTAPSEMEKRKGTSGTVTSFTFEKTITGSSVEDLSIYFKIVSPIYIDPTIIVIAVGIVFVAVLGITGFIIKKTR